MKYLQDFNFTNKRVLVRVDFNVPIEDDKVVDDFRIKASLPTINYLLERNARIILISHLGRPTGKEKKYTLYPAADHLSQLLNQPVLFIGDCTGREVKEKIEKLKAGEIALLENLRFYEEEKNNDENFAKELSSFADVYVNDAFSVSHREHSSIVGIPLYLSSFLGLLFQKEIKVLSKISENPSRPILVIIGGIKIKTKIKVIKKFLKKADNLILGGALANTVLYAKGIAVGVSEIEEDVVDEIRAISITDTKLHLPCDAVVAENSDCAGEISPIGKIPQDKMILDIGPDSVDLFSDVISDAKTIVWNGPMGFFEKKEFSEGTKGVAKSITESDSFSVVGGGETVTFIRKLGLADKFSHICSGGGAMLQFLTEGTLPGIEAIKENSTLLRLKSEKGLLSN